MCTSLARKTARGAIYLIKNTNEKENIDPIGFYLKLGYLYDQIATEHNSVFVDKQNWDLTPDRKEKVKTKMNLAALGGVLQKPLR